MTLTLPRLSSISAIVGSDGKANATFSGFWNTFATQLEDAVNQIEDQVTGLQEVYNASHVNDGTSSLPVSGAMVGTDGTVYLDNGSIQDNAIVGTKITTAEASKGYTTTQTGGPLTCDAAVYTEVLRVTVTALGGVVSLAMFFAMVGRADSGDYGNCMWKFHYYPVGTSAGGDDCGAGQWFARDGAEIPVAGFGFIDSGVLLYGEQRDIVLLVEGDGTKRPNIDRAQIQIDAQR